jgi:protein-disulfide isomerase
MMLMWGIDRRTGGSESIKAETAGNWSDEASPVPVTSQDPTWGSRTAPVTIVLFSDFECPFCSRVEQSLNEVKQTYGKDKVRVVWKSNPLPFHKSAKPASVAAETVRALGGNDAFWKFHEKAFQNQRELTRENFEKWARESGVNLEKFKQALDANTYAAKVDKDLALGQSLGVQGTPHSLINGIAVGGAQPVAKFKEVVDEQLKKAQALQASGTKPTQLYVELTKQNKAAEPKQPDQPKQPDKKPEPPAEDTTVWKVPIAGSPARGGKNALVTIVIFSDYQCPFCKRVEDTLTQVEKDYGEKVRFVWKDRPLPFHNRAEPAAELCREARKQKGDAGFWKCHDKLFENQSKLEDADLEGYAKDLGIDVAKVKEAISKKKYEAEINADNDLGDQVKASGTPHMFINGRRLVGAQPIDSFKKLIDEQIPKAQDLVKGGTAADKVYEKIMETAKTPEPPPPPEKKDLAAPTKENPAKGNLQAKVVVQVVSDFECPFCKRVEDTLKQVEENYGKKVKIVWRNKPLPFHQKAMPAAEASMEAFKQKGNDGFWKMHKKLFDNQSTPNGLERAALEKYAEELGLDMGKFKAALDDHTHKAAIEADSKAADTAGISGTPGIVVNGYFIGGAQPYKEFQRIIELALKEAK